MNYSLSERKLKIGKQAGKTVRIARARVRGRVSFARFCDLVAEHTTFNYMEVASILNLSADMARGLLLFARICQVAQESMTGNRAGDIKKSRDRQI